MSDIARLIIEQTAAGKIDQTAAALLIEKVYQNATPAAVGDIAIIGIGAKMPQAENYQAFWRMLREGADSIREYPEARRRDSDFLAAFYTAQSPGGFNYYRGGHLEEVDKFDYQFFRISLQEARLIDPNQRLFLETAWEAIEDAGYGGNKLVGSRTGIYLGYSTSAIYGQYIAKTAPEQVRLSVNGNVPSVTASRLAHLLDLKGPSILVDTACSSSLVAIHLACQALKHGECNMALAGGVKINLIPVQGMVNIGINSDTGQVRAFDEQCDGTTWGEGVAAILLKPLKEAIQDGDRIHAVIKGSAINQDGASVGISAPNVLAQKDVLERAWADAGIEPETLTYIEAHGTGTKLGDPVEIDAIQKAFRKHTTKKQFCAIGTVKTNIGHLENSAGVAGLIKAVLALKYKEIPPSLHFNQPNQRVRFEESPVYVNDCLRKWETGGQPRRCGVSSFGFSGTNCHLVLEEPPRPEEPIPGSGPWLLALSAKDATQLRHLVSRYNEWIQQNELSDPASLCYTANTGRGHYPLRLAVVCSDYPDLQAKFARIAATLTGQAPDSEGIFYGNQITGKNETIPSTTGYPKTKSTELNREMETIIQSYPGNGNQAASHLKKIAELYVQGADVDWEKLYQGQKYQKINLPVVPFQRSRCWFETGSPVEVIQFIPNGKIVRNASLERRGESDPGVEYEAPHNEVETELALIWQEELKIGRVGIHDNFFSLGGDSFSAMQVIAKLTDFKLGLTDFFQHPTIAELSQWIQPTQKTGENTLEIAEETAGVYHKDLPTVKILDEIEPFNDIFYQSCFNNAAFPVIRFFHREIDAVLAHDVFVYDYDDQKPGMKLGVKYIPTQKIENLLAEMDIELIIKITCPDLIPQIISAISQNRPVIINVDCFYLPLRKDTYQKMHWPHSILVYGYDQPKQLFNIIDHDDIQSLTYQTKPIHFRDLANAYRGFLASFQKGEPGSSYYEFSSSPDARPGIHQADHDPQMKRDDYPLVLLDNLAANQNIIKRAFDNINLFKSDLIKVFADQSLLNNWIDSLIFGMNEIIKAKNAERYRIARLISRCPEALQALDSVIDEWNLIKGMLEKYQLTNMIRNPSFEKTIMRLDRIYSLENQYNQGMIDIRNGWDRSI